MKITVLVESVRDVRGLRGGFGLSLWVEACGARFLFDFGPPGGAFLDNARALGIDVATADFAVLSHGHYDHGGSLDSFYEANTHASVYAARNAFEGHTMRKWWKDRPVGIDPGLYRAERIVPVDGDLEIMGGIDIVRARNRDGFIPRANRGAGRMPPGATRPVGPDDFSHEMAVLVREGGKSCLLSACSHTGITNMADSALAHSGLARLDAVVGGMHLFHSIWTWPAWKRDVRELGRRLSTYDGTVWHTGHCTLDEGYAILSRVPGLDARRLETGRTISI